MRLHTGVLSWNIVPWYLGAASVKPSKDEVASGVAELRHLSRYLPKVEVVITGGRYAQNVSHIAAFTSNELTVIPTWHPSPPAARQA
ncbi:nicotinamide mononucleotide adenylyltransferase [Marisediminicola sp. UYEF4]|uniref:uracil-DNA glycosylase family protein n=1 Tax=Marisediminicola sp. UYEF4 TaxID=1756384 RepID=UPI003394D7E6